MNNFLTLTKVFFLSGFNVNKKKGNQRSTFLVLGLFGLLFLAISAFYNFMMASSVIELGGDLKDNLANVCSIAIMMTMALSMMQMQSAIFKTLDYEFLESLPIGKKTIVAAKIAAVYLMSLFEDLIIVVPGAVTYVILSGELYPAIMAVLSTFFLSVMPLLFSSILGLIVAYATSKSRHESVVTAIFYVIYFVLIFAFSFSLSMGTSQIGLSPIVRSLGYTIWLRESFESGHILEFLYFGGVNILAFIMVVVLISLVYRRINSALLAGKALKAYERGGDTGATSLERSVLKKEFNFVFRKPQYMINSFIGPIFFLVFGIMMPFAYTVFTGDIEADPSELAEIASVMVAIGPFMGVLFCSMMSSTTASISLECKGFELLKSYPVRPAIFIKAKTKVGIYVLGGMSLAAGIILSVTVGIGYGFNPAVVVADIVLPTLAAINSSIIGMLCGLRWPKLDFQSEQQVFKNSAAANLNVLFNVLFSLVVGGLTVGGLIADTLTGGNLSYVFLPIAIAIYAASILLFSTILGKKGEKLFQRI